jgi:hypothetical protein
MRPSKKSFQKRVVFQSIKILTIIFTAGLVVGLLLVLIQKWLHIPQVIADKYILIVLLTLLVIGLPFIVLFYIGYAKDLGGHDHDD